MNEIQKAILLLIENGYRVEKTKVAFDIELNKASPKEFQPDILSKPIDDLGLNIRSMNCLKTEGIRTVQDLIKYSRYELFQIPNFGRKSITDVIEKLNEKGLFLKTPYSN